MRYRYKNKGKDFTLSDTSEKGVGTLTTQKLRLQVRYAPASSWLLKTSLDGSQVDFVTKEGPDRGFVCGESVTFAPKAFPCSFDVTGAYFHTDSYDSRQTVYEKGLLNAFSFSSYYGRGVRCAAQVRCDLGEHWMLLAKYGWTRYADRESIGTSQQLIEGHLKRDVQLQVRVKF